MNKAEYRKLRAMVRANGLAYAITQMTPDQIAVFTVLDEQNIDYMRFRARVERDALVRIRLWPWNWNPCAYPSVV